jgi:hypothetical protein
MNKKELIFIAFGTVLTFAVLLGIGVDTQDSVDYIESDIYELKSEVSDLDGRIYAIERRRR